MLSSMLATQSAIYSGAAGVVSGLSPVLMWTGGIVVFGIVAAFLSGFMRRGHAKGPGSVARLGSSSLGVARAGSSRATRGKARAKIARSPSGRVVLSDAIAGVLNDPGTVRREVDYGRAALLVDRGEKGDVDIGSGGRGGPGVDRDGRIAEGLFG